MDIILRTTTHLYEKDGHVFYNITGTQVDYTLDGLKLRLDNLFDGVNVLGIFHLIPINIFFKSFFKIILIIFLTFQ